MKIVTITMMMMVVGMVVVVMTLMMMMMMMVGMVVVVVMTLMMTTTLIMMMMMVVVVVVVRYRSTIGPVVNGDDLLPADVQHLMSRQNAAMPWSRISVLLGFVSNEGTLAPWRFDA